MGAGTGFCDDAAARAFFTVGRQYRARGFVATSYFKCTAQDFIKRVRSRPTPPARIGLGQSVLARRLRTHGVQVVFADPVSACVLWRIELDLARGCNYVNLVTATHVEVRTRCAMQHAALGMSWARSHKQRYIEMRRIDKWRNGARCVI